jgi:hypothetical protein
MTPKWGIVTWMSGVGRSSSILDNGLSGYSECAGIMGAPSKNEEMTGQFVLSGTLSPSPELPGDFWAPK